MAKKKVADFETSKIIKYKEVERTRKWRKEHMFDEFGNFIGPKAAFIYDEETEEFIKGVYEHREVDVENSKTWVYHWGIENYDLTEFVEGYDIESFMNYIEWYEHNILAKFHNAKFDDSFILYYMLQRPDKYKQIFELKNENIVKKKAIEEKNANLWLSSVLMTPFKDQKRPNIEKYDVERWLKKTGLIKKTICQVDATLFTTSVNNMGVMYSIRIFYLKQGKPLHYVEITDSLKLLNFSVRQLGKDFFNENFEKLHIDYSKIRPANRPDLLTQQDHDYLKRDLDIIAKCLTILENSSDICGDHDKQTIASLALDDFKTMWARKILKKDEVTHAEKEAVFRETFPAFRTIFNSKGELVNEYDDFIRNAYKGGFCYAYKINPTNDNDDDINISDKGMCVLDVNSLFPFCMKTKPMPFGMPITVKGKGLNMEGYVDIQHIDDKEIETLYDYYFVHFKVKFKLKKDRIPTIMLKGRDTARNMRVKKDKDGNVIYNKKGEVEMECPLPPNEYLESSEGLFVDMYMTKDDFELMLEQYDILDEEGNVITPKDLEIIEVYYFQSVIGIFDDYIDKWAKVKIEAGKEKNKSRRQLAKIFLNSLYGRFALKIRNSFKYFYIDDKNKLNSDSKVENVDEPIYTPVAAAITAAGRRITIEASQKLMNYGLNHNLGYVYCYSDTDSIHTRLSREEVIECLGSDIDINNSGEFGLWKIEEDNIIKSKFIRPKTYLEERREPNEDGEIWNTGIAGLPKDIQKCLSWDSFRKGIVIVGKLMPIQVEGGTALVESSFEIK